MEGYHPHPLLSTPRFPRAQITMIENVKSVFSTREVDVPRGTFLKKVLIRSTDLSLSVRHGDRDTDTTMKVVFTIHHHTGDNPWYKVYQGRVLKMSGTRLLDVPEGLQRLVYEKLSKKEKSVIDEVEDVPKFVPTISDIDPVGDYRVTTIGVYTNIDGGDDEWFGVDVNGKTFGMGNCLLDVFDTVECGVIDGTEIPWYPRTTQPSPDEQVMI